MAASLIVICFVDRKSLISPMHRKYYLILHEIRKSNIDDGDL